jgi:hypothetical protein
MLRITPIRGKGARTYMEERCELMLDHELVLDVKQIAELTGRTLDEIVEKGLTEYIAHIDSGEIDPRDEADFLFGPDDGSNLPAAEAEFIFAMPTEWSLEEKLKRLKAFRAADNNEEMGHA